MVLQLIDDRSVIYMNYDVYITEEEKIFLRGAIPALSWLHSRVYLFLRNFWCMVLQENVKVTQNGNSALTVSTLRLSYLLYDWWCMTDCIVDIQYSTDSSNTRLCHIVDQSPYNVASNHLS